MKNKSFILTISILSVILGIALFERVSGLFVQGISGNDNFYYWNTAKAWFDGDITLTFHYRPLAYFSYFQVFNIMGSSDLSLKIFNISIDMLNMILIFILVQTNLKDRFLAILSVIIYSLLPVSIIHSRQELLHILSEFWILLHILFFTLAYRVKKMGLLYFFLAVSAIFLSCAANTHPDLIVLVIPAILFIYLKSRGDGFYEKIGTFSIQSIIFTVGALSIFIVSMFYFGFADVVLGFLKNSQTQKSSGENSFLLTFYRVLINFTSKNTSLAMAIIFYLGVIYLYVLDKAKKPLLITYGVTVSIFYMVIYAKIVPKYMIERLFIPFIPIVIIVVLYSFRSVFQKYLVKYSKFYIVFMILFTSVILFFNRYRYLDHLSLSQHIPPSQYKRSYDLLKGHLGLGDRVLVTPLASYRGRFPFEQSVYFGKHGEYISKTADISFSEIIQNYNYLIISKVQHDKRLINEDYYKKVKTLYNIDEREYSIAVEIKWIKEYILNNKIDIFYKDKYFEIYKL